MISAPVRVIAVKDRIAQVQTTERSGCGGCVSRDNCGISGLGKFFSGRHKAIEVKCDAGVRAGDELQLDLSEGDLIKAGLLAYLVPCVFAIASAGLATLAGFGDGVAAFGALCGLVLGLMLMRIFNWSPDIAVRLDHSPNEGGTP